MPVVKVDYDKTKVSGAEVKSLVKALHEIIVAATDIKEVPVYADGAEITYEIFPVEVYIQLSAHLVADGAELSGKIRDDLLVWMKENKFKHLVNMTLIPMVWNMQLDIDANA